MKNSIMNGWFSEVSPMWPGRALSIEIKEHLYSNRSKFQQIDVFETASCGMMLVLDNIIQAVEVDEFAYQEMLAHLPLCSHPNPEKVLVIGGGDGGILREIAKHVSVKEIDICEIDEDVINISKKFIPSMSCGFDDSRVSVHIADGSEFIKDKQGYYDVIIVDSSDPIGPAEALFEKPFYAHMKTALNSTGIIATQAESFFMHKEIVKALVSIVRELFPVSGYAFTLVPTYPGGNIGICMGSNAYQLTKPGRKLSMEFLSELKYYTPQIHEASFVFPKFAADYLGAVPKISF